MKTSLMKLLQAATVFIGMAVLAFMLWMPYVEGVNANATSLREIYFDDLFLAYVYVGSIPFFVGLYKAFKVAGYAQKNDLFSERAVQAIRTMKYCALATAVLIVGAEVFAWTTNNGQDDITGFAMLGIITTTLCIATFAALAKLEKVLKAKK